MIFGHYQVTNIQIKSSMNKDANTQNAFEAEAFLMKKRLTRELRGKTEEKRGNKTKITIEQGKWPKKLEKDKSYFDKQRLYKQIKKPYQKAIDKQQQEKTEQ